MARCSRSRTCARTLPQISRAEQLSFSRLRKPAPYDSDVSHKSPRTLFRDCPGRPIKPDSRNARWDRQSSTKSALSALCSIVPTVRRSIREAYTRARAHASRETRGRSERRTDRDISYRYHRLRLVLGTVPSVRSCGTGRTAAGQLKACRAASPPTGIKNWGDMGVLRCAGQRSPGGRRLIARQLSATRLLQNSIRASGLWIGPIRPGDAPFSLMAWDWFQGMGAEFHPAISGRGWGIRRKEVLR